MTPMTIWLDDVRLSLRAKSDRDLSLKLNKTPGMVGQWRRGESYPSEDMMRYIAKRAGLDVEQALLIRAYHMSRGETQRAYGRIFEKLRMVVPCAIMALFIWIMRNADPAFALEPNALKAFMFLPALHMNVSLPELYIMR